MSGMPIPSFSFSDTASLSKNFLNYPTQSLDAISLKAELCLGRFLLIDLCVLMYMGGAVSLYFVSFRLDI